MKMIYEDREVEVYDIIYDRTGCPKFLIYDNGQWIRRSAKHFKPYTKEDKKPLNIETQGWKQSLEWNDIMLHGYPEKDGKYLCVDGYGDMYICEFHKSADSLTIANSLYLEMHCRLKTNVFSYWNENFGDMPADNIALWAKLPDIPTFADGRSIIS